MTPSEKVTKCETCGVELAYKTKKPKWCKAHKPVGPKPYKPAKGAPIKSKKEFQVHYFLNKILPEADSVDNGYFSWLPSPKGSPMQIDRFYPDLKIAIEFNGKQHYQYNSFMHTSKDAFEYLRSCDSLKAKLLKKRGIHLITIKYDKEITMGYLVRRLKEEGLLEMLRSQTVVLETYEY